MYWLGCSGSWLLHSDIFSCNMRDPSCGMRDLSLWPRDGARGPLRWDLGGLTAAPREKPPLLVSFNFLHSFQLHFLYLFESKYCFTICYMLCIFNLKSPTSCLCQCSLQSCSLNPQDWAPFEWCSLAVMRRARGQFTVTWRQKCTVIRAAVMSPVDLRSSA